MENNNWEKELSKLALEAEIHPPDEIWNSIEEKLAKPAKYKKPLPGIFLGAIIVIVFLVAFAFRDSIFTSKFFPSAKGSHSSESLQDFKLSDKSVIPDYNNSGHEGSFHFQLSEKPYFMKHIDNFSMRNNAVFNKKDQNITLHSEDETLADIFFAGKSTEFSKIINSPYTSNSAYVNLEDIQHKDNTRKKNISSIGLPKFEGNISTLTATAGSVKNLTNLKVKHFVPVYSQNELAGVSPIDCPKFKVKNRLLLYTDIELGIGYSLRHIRPKNVEASEYAGMRRSSEDVWYNAGGAIHLGLIWSGISVDFGMEYFQLNEVFTGNRENEKRITINIIEDDMGQIIGRDTIIETGTREVVARNIYKQYLLPIRVGYLQSKGNFTFGVHVGGAYTFSNHVEGVIFDTNGTYYGIGSDDNKYFHKEGYWKIITGFYLGYKAGKNIELFLRPQISLDQRSMDNINASASQKYNNIQLFGGIRYFIP